MRGKSSFLLGFWSLVVFKSHLSWTLINYENLVGWVRRKWWIFQLGRTKISVFMLSTFSFYISGAISGESSFRSTFNNGFGKDNLLCLVIYSDFCSCISFIHFFVDLRENGRLIFQILTIFFIRNLISFEGKPDKCMFPYFRKNKFLRILQIVCHH